MTPLRHGLAALAAALLPGFARAAAPAAPACPDCNVILIAVDTLRPDHLGCYGYGKPTSPNIDRLAARGTVFDDFIVQGYLTPISMASILSSRYPSFDGMTTFSSRLDPDVDTLPEAFRRGGYRTAAFMTSAEFFVSLAIPEKRGGAVDMPPTFSRGFDVFQPAGNRETPRRRRVEGWLEKVKNDRFFLWLALGSVHWPYAGKAPERFKRMFGPAHYSGPLHAGDFYDEMGLIYDGLYYPQPGAGRGAGAKPAVLTDEDRAFLLGRYDAGIAYTDDYIGRLEDALRRLDLDRKTIIVLVSEHAEDLGEHGYFTHYDIHQTETRGAFIVVDPRLEGAPRRSQALVSGLDVAPTILALAGLPPLRGAQGRSLAPLAAGLPAAADSAVFSERAPPWEAQLYALTEWSDLRSFPTLVGGFCGMMAKALKGLPDPAPWDVSVQTKEWKLIDRRSRELLEKVSWWGYLSGRPPAVPEYELYRLTDDPTEKRNVVSLYPKEAAKLRSLLSAWENDPERLRLLRRPRPAPRQLIPYP